MTVVRSVLAGLLDGWNDNGLRELNLAVELLRMRNIFRIDCGGRSVSTIADGAAVEHCQVDIRLALSAASGEGDGVLINLRVSSSDFLLMEVNDLLLTAIGASELAEDDSSSEGGVLLVPDSLEGFSEVTLARTSVVHRGFAITTIGLVVLSIVTLLLVAALRGSAVSGWGLAVATSNLVAVSDLLVGLLRDVSAVADLLASLQEGLSFGVVGGSAIDVAFRSVVSSTCKLGSFSHSSAAHHHVVSIVNLELSDLITLGPFSV